MPGGLAGKDACATGCAGFEGEFVEEGVFAIMGRPNSNVVAQGDAALSGFPKELCVGMFGEFVQADIAAVHCHGLRVGREGQDAGAVVELDDAHFEFVGEGGGAAIFVEARHFVEFLAVRDDGPSVVE